MAWPFVSNRKIAPPMQPPLTQAALATDFSREGICFTTKAALGCSWLSRPLDFGNETGKVALLGQLEEEGFALWRDSDLLLGWSAMYELLDHPDYRESVPLLGLPSVDAWRPVLSSEGSLGDPDFSIILAGWIGPNGKRHQGPVKLIGARLASTNTASAVLLSQHAWETVEALVAFHQRLPAERNLEANKRSWARIRRLALLAQADLSDFLKKTVVLTPERLNIGLRKAQIGESKTVEVLPGFDDAPEGWLEAFDRSTDVRGLYQISEGEGLVHVLLAPEVQTVLREIKGFPGRRVSGERAEAFVRNPFAVLGADAAAVIDPVQFEQARERAGISYARFIAKEHRDQNSLLTGASLLVNECIRGALRSEELQFKDAQELKQFVDKLGAKIKRGAQCCLWKGYELELLGDSPDQLTLLRRTLDELSAPLTIKIEELFDLSRYSDAIAGFGVEKPCYSPFIARKDQGEGWFPENRIDVVMYTPDGAAEPIALTLGEETLTSLAVEVQQAQACGDETISLPGCPKPIKVSDAENLVNTFRKAHQDMANGAFEASAVQHVNLPKETKKLVLKANVEQVAHLEQRGLLRSSKGNFPYTLPKSLKADVRLKDHQLLGLGWLQYLWAQSPEFCRGSILADDMGLGKTLQLLCCILACYEADPVMDPVLIVAPVSLLDNWQEELKNFFNADAIPLMTLYGPDLAEKRLPKKIVDTILDVNVGSLLRDNWLGNAKLVMTTYETLRDLEFSLAGQRWSMIVCDEAQKIKNPNAMVTRAAKKQNARLKIACTGTPVENSLTDLWCLFDFVQPGLLGALNTFSTDYRKPIEAENDEQKAKVQELRTLIEPQIMRRIKADVARDLPAKTEVESCRNLFLSDYQRGLYAQAVQRFRQRAPEEAAAGLQSSLGLLQYLRRLCADPRPPGQQAVVGESLVELERRSPKMAWLMSTLAEIKLRDQGKGEKTIIFCEFRDLQRTLQRAIAERFGRVPDIINGDTSTKSGSSASRQQRIKKFQADDGFGVIILSPLAVGFGVNIQAANHVIHFTRPWNPAKEDQSTDRAYRIGQTKEVFVYYPTVTAKDFTTFDAKLDKLLTWRRALANDMLNGAGELSPTDFGDLEDVDGSSALGDEFVSAEDIAAMTPEGFEMFCAALWNAHGYSRVYTTPSSGDGGIDVVALKEKDGVLIQCKTSSSPDQELGWDAVKEVVAGAAAYTARHPGIAFQKVACTNQRFNKAARTQALLNHVKLIDREVLARMMEERNIMQRDFGSLFLRAR